MLDSIQELPKSSIFDRRKATLEHVHVRMTGVIESVLLVADRCNEDAPRSGVDLGPVLNNGADLLSDVNVEISAILDRQNEDFPRRSDIAGDGFDLANRAKNGRETCLSLASKLPELWRMAETRGDDDTIHGSIRSVVDHILSTEPMTLADVATQLALSGEERLEPAAILIARLAGLDLRLIAGERFLDRLHLPVNGDASDKNFRSVMDDLRRKISGVSEMLALAAGRSDSDVSGVLANDSWLLSRICAEIGTLIDPTCPGEVPALPASPGMPRASSQVYDLALTLPTLRRQRAEAEKRRMGLKRGTREYKQAKNIEDAIEFRLLAAAELVLEMQALTLQDAVAQLVQAAENCADLEAREGPQTARAIRSSLSVVAAAACVDLAEIWPAEFSN